MNFLLPILQMALGFTLLWKGGNWLVDGASQLASRFKLSPMIIGLTIVAFGTSAPELAVNVMASIAGTPSIVMGNILGSNLCNILLILGVSSLIYPISIRPSNFKIDIPISLIATLAIVGAVYVGAPNVLSRLEGLVLLGGFILFLAATFNTSQEGNDVSDPVETHGHASLLNNPTLLVVVGCIALPLGGKFVTDPAIVLASTLGISQVFIALFTIAVGTSLPELATSVTAALKGKSDMAFGNIIGSNIFNILLVLGVSMVINPIPFDPMLTTELTLIVLSTLAIAGFAKLNVKRQLTRWHGAVFLSVYVLYLVFAFMRG
jgi:cation:H+ antiporter